MQHGIFSNEISFKFPQITGDLSAGRSVSTNARFSRNANGKSQTLARRGRLQAQSFTVNLSVNRTIAGNIELYISEAESIVGCAGELFWCGVDFGLVVVESVGVSCVLDNDGIALCSIALNLKEGIIRTGYREISISTL
jgi:hypothetical protein